MVWFGLVALGCWLVEKMLGKIAKWLFLTPVALVWGGWLLFEKHVGKIPKFGVSSMVVGEFEKLSFNSIQFSLYCMKLYM